MNRALLRRFSHFTRHSLCTQPKFQSNPTSLASLAAASARDRLRFYSSDSHSFKEANFDQTQNRNVSVHDVDDVSTQELKKRIEKYYEGDEEALPSIFEAILKRKLSGIHDDEDDKLMEELGKNFSRDDIKDELKDPDIDELDSDLDDGVVDLNLDALQDTEDDSE